MNIHMEFTHTHSCRKLTKRVQALNYYIFATTTALKLGMSHAFAAKSAFISCWDMVTLGVWHDEELPSNCVSKYKLQKNQYTKQKGNANVTRINGTRVGWLVVLLAEAKRSMGWRYPLTDNDNNRFVVATRLIYFFFILIGANIPIHRHAPCKFYLCKFELCG